MLTVGTVTGGVSVNNGTGKAVDIATGVLAVTLASASSTGSTTNGIHLASTTGSFTVSWRHDPDGAQAMASRCRA